MSVSEGFIALVGPGCRRAAAPRLAFACTAGLLCCPGFGVTEGFSGLGVLVVGAAQPAPGLGEPPWDGHHRRRGDRQSTRLNSSHVATSYAVSCSKTKTQKTE